MHPWATPAIERTIRYTQTMDCHCGTAMRVLGEVHKDYEAGLRITTTEWVCPACDNRVTGKHGVSSNGPVEHED